LKSKPTPKPLQAGPPPVAALGLADRPGETFQHKLEQFNPGMVWLDADQRITALNDIALHILGPSVQETMGLAPDSLIGSNILQIHPPKSREKIEFLLRNRDQHGHAMVSPPPLAMMITIPDRLLMIKVSQMAGAHGSAGTCMIFYDFTDATTAPSIAPELPGVAPAPRLLSRIPVYRRERIVLVDVKDIGHFEGEGHYTNIVTASERHLCNLSMSVLEARLDPEYFLRVHRSHIINLSYVVELIRAEDGMLVAMPPGMGSPVPVSKNNLARLKARFGLV
jgi:hypothetical protein